MTDPAPTAANDATNPEARPTSLAERVMAAQARIAERTAPARAKAGEQARAAANGATQFVKDHPALAITGALVAGAAIAFALPGKSGRKLREGAMALGGLVAELATTYGTQMLAMADQAAETSKEKLDEIGESFSSASEAIADKATETGEAVIETVKRAGEATAAQAQSLVDKIKR